MIPFSNVLKKSYDSYVIDHAIAKFKLLRDDVKSESEIEEIIKVELDRIEHEPERFSHSLEKFQRKYFHLLDYDTARSFFDIIFSRSYSEEEVEKYMSSDNCRYLLQTIKADRHDALVGLHLENKSDKTYEDTRKRYINMIDEFIVAVVNNGFNVPLAIIKLTQDLKEE